jgi:hypothetical protein
MAKLTRRGFIASGAAVGATAAGVAVGLPLSRLVSPSAALPAAELSSAVAARKNTGPVVAYVRDPARGELELLVGNTGVTVTDKDLVARILRAAG